MINIFGAEVTPSTVQGIVISGIFSVILALIAVYGKDKLNKPKRKEPIDSAFGRMEQLADRLQKENDVLRKENDRLQEENTILRIENAQIKR